ncbi:MAG: CinA family nicotinamide mononucleotide deamidase-related protein [Syntrophobacteria bacterium]
MPGELITIGDELLQGRVANNNAAHIARHLGLGGFEFRWVTVVGDQEEDISTALLQAMERASFVVLTGGLGPTEDDRTSAAAAAALGRPLRRDSVSWEILTNHLKKVNISMTPGIAKMADLPQGAQRIDRSRPRAGFYIGDAVKPLFFLPGVPDEMADMLADFVLPTLRQKFPGQMALRSRILHIFGLRESEIAKRLADVAGKYSSVRLGYLPRFPENHLSLTVRAPTEAEADATLEEAARSVRKRLGLYVYGEGDDTLEQVVGRLLGQKKVALAVAESCTGGLIGHLITEVSGSSTYFDRCMVTYSNAAKVAHLHVPPEIIDRCGAVSAETADAMVRGIQKESGASLAVAVTGIAGPSGGTAEKPVGTVFLALLHEERLRLERFQFRGTRHEIKTVTAHTALDWMRRAMVDASFFPGT